METSIRPSAINAVIILMAIASLFSMISLNQINYIVHRDLYNFGLIFSYRWAMPYWVFSGVVFGLCWANIALAIIVTVYINKKARKNMPKPAKIQVEIMEASKQQEEQNKQRNISEFFESEKEAGAPQIAETKSEEPIGQEVEQPEEAIETLETEESEEPLEIPAEQQAVEHVEETEEISIPNENSEQSRQSVL